MSNEVAYQEAAAPQAAPEPQPAQPSLAQHAFEYALAGSFDGLRSGVSSAVGGQIGQWCGGALARTGSVSGTAFVNVVSKIPFLKKFVKPAMCANPSQSAADAAAAAAAAQVPITGVCVCYVTVPTDEVADMLSGLLVENGLAACVNQIPGVTSTYIWEGKVQKDTESLLMIKTNREQLADVAAVVKEKHPYDNPEFICLDVVTGLPDYIAWVRGKVSPDQLQQ